MWVEGTMLAIRVNTYNQDRVLYIIKVDTKVTYRKPCQDEFH